MLREHIEELIAKNLEFKPTSGQENLIKKKTGLIGNCGFDCKMRTKACTIQPARRLMSAKNGDFCVCFGDPQTRGFQSET